VRCGSKIALLFLRGRLGLNFGEAAVQDQEPLAGAPPGPGGERPAPRLACRWLYPPHHREFARLNEN
jgi:hypothetical protein